MRKIESILIIANGSREDINCLRALAKEHDYIIALDGGADTALAAGVMPDLALGDLDSISAAAKKKLGALRLFQIPRQDNTDLEKGLDFAAFLRPRNVTIACAAGGRIDFTLSNFSSVFSYTKKLNIVFKGCGWRIYPIEKTTKFSCKKGAKVSIMPVDNFSRISLKNLVFPLKNAIFGPGQTAVSNISLKNNFTVQLKGRLLVMIYD